MPNPLTGKRMKGSTWNTYNISGGTEKYLYKFLSLKDLNRFLKSGDIWFSRSDIFGDKMECVMIADLLKPQLPLQAIEKRKKKFLISCWHIANKESLALWDTYAKSDKKRRKVAIRFNRSFLIALIKKKSPAPNLPTNFKEQVYGRIKYRALIGLSPRELMAKQMKEISYRKEYSFRYESEFRFVIKLTSEFSRVGIGFNIGNPQNIPFDILVNPLLERDDYLQTLKMLESGEFKKKVRESALAKWLKPELY